MLDLLLCFIILMILMLKKILSRYYIYIILFILSLAIYGGLFGQKLFSGHSIYNHYIYLADAFLHGRLDLEGTPPNANDWANYNNKWFVAFPPVPAVTMIPAVAIWGIETNDNIIAWLWSPFPVILLFLLLETLSKIGRSPRTKRENLILTILFGFGTVYFFTTVQGTVWYVAHTIGLVFLILYVLFALDGKRPFLCGLFLALAYGCRPTMIFAFPIFLYEITRNYVNEDADSFWSYIKIVLKNINYREFFKKALLFSIPLIIIIAAWMILNYIRFDNPFDQGYHYLRIRWSNRIATWGLFNYHYLSRNICVILALLPWFTRTFPYIQISRHGLALWFTTPNFLYVLSPKNTKGLFWPSVISTILVAIPSLFYQNSGWTQFGYRFSLDYTIFLIMMIALNGRKFTKLFYLFFIFAILVNLFGAITYDRFNEFYNNDLTQKVFFQPD